MYIGLGRVSGVKILREFWEFDPSQAHGSRWKRMPDFPGNFNRYEANYSYQNKLYIGLGFNFTAESFAGRVNTKRLSNEFWEFTPE